VSRSGGKLACRHRHVSPPFRPCLSLADLDPLASQEIGEREVVPHRVAGEIDGVQRVPAKVPAQARSAEERGPCLRARAEDLAIPTFDPRRPALEDAALSVPREGVEDRPGLLDMHREARVRESVARDPRSDQQPSRAHARMDRSCPPPALEPAVSLEHLVQQGGHQPTLSARNQFRAADGRTSRALRRQRPPRQRRTQDACLFQYGIAAYDLQIGKYLKGRTDKDEFRRQGKKVLAKIGRHLTRDYVLHPLLSGPSALTTVTANLTANLIRNLWTHSVIMCGHFPDGVQTYEKTSIDGETRGQWYLRQMLGSANISGNALLHFMTGNLSFQIEHHLFPDLPSNRYQEIAPKVQELFDRYRLTYTSGPLPRQVASAWKKVFRLSLPNDFLRKTTPSVPAGSGDAQAA
jgi:Fatty acid desaturase